MYFLNHKTSHVNLQRIFIEMFYPRANQIANAGLTIITKSMIVGECGFRSHLIYSGSKNSYEIYKYARSAIDPKVEFSRYDVPKAGLQLFARHASQFSQYLIEDYEVCISSFE